MNLTIKLKPCGKKNQKFFKIIVTHINKKRNSIEKAKIGLLKIFKEKQKKTLLINSTKLKHWLTKGAIPNNTTLKILSTYLILNNNKNE